MVSGFAKTSPMVKIQHIQIVSSEAKYKIPIVTIVCNNGKLPPTFEHIISNNFEFFVVQGI